MGVALTSGEKSLFITGGTGFVGKSLLRNLSQPQVAGGMHSITVLSRDPASFLKNHPEFSEISNLSFVHGDLLTFEGDGRRYTHVIHAAADTSRKALSDPIRQFNEIVVGTRRMLDFAVAVGATRFLLTSSGAIYGAQPSGLERIPEAYSGAPQTMDPDATYGTAKRMAEHLCRIYYDQFGLECLIARCFAFVGEYMPMNGHYAMGNFLRDALSKETGEIKVHGDGTAIRSYLHAQDMADWLLTILDVGLPCRPYNVGSEEGISISALAHLVRDLLAPHKAVNIAGQLPEYAGRSVYVPSVKRIQEELNVGVPKSLRAAICTVAESLSK